MRRLLIRKFIMKVASYFCKFFCLLSKSIGFKLHNAAQVNIKSSTCCIIVTGMVPFKILKHFILFIALSTWIHKFATSFQICYFLHKFATVFFTSVFVIWFFTLAPDGTTNLQKSRSKSSWLWKPCQPLLHHLFLINHKTHYLWWWICHLLDPHNKKTGTK